MAKKLFTTDVQIGTRGAMSVADLRAAAKADPTTFATKAVDLIQRGEVTLSNMDLRGLFQALHDVHVPAVVDIGAGVTRAIQASAFPLLVGNAVVAGVNAAYEGVPTIGEELVSDMEDNKRITTIAAIHDIDTGVDRVDENKDFPEISATEEKYEIRSKRNGRRLSLTMETIEENNIADFVNRVNTLGEIAADFVEEQTLDRFTDRYGSAGSPAEPYVLRLNGVGVQLYDTVAKDRAPSGTRKTSNALADETDLEAARLILADMRNSRGKRINVWRNGLMKLVVPDALVNKANRLLNSELVPGTENELNVWGPRGSYRPKIVSSPKLDDISTTTWYMGDPQRQFKRKWKIRLEFASLTGEQTEAFLKRRIAGQWRVAWDVEIGATDYIYVVQSQA